LLKPDVNPLPFLLGKAFTSDFDDRVVWRSGGAEEDRTPDLLRARQALSQLSYGPFIHFRELI
jgi:hypothetical protein